MTSGNDSKRDLELVPITEQIEAKVQQAVGEPIASEPASPPPSEPTPLELAEIEPLPGELWEAPPARNRHAMKWIAIVVMVALGCGAFLVFTDAGRRLLPASMQPEAKSVARDIERRANELGRDEFYTFTDDQGVVHIVDDPEKVPPEYRARAKKKR